MELLPNFLQSGHGFGFQRTSSRSQLCVNKRKAPVRLTSTVKPSKTPKRSEINLYQMNHFWESKYHATVQTMLDRRGDKLQASATPYTISCFKTRHSDKKPVSRQVIADPYWGVKRPGAGREYPSARRDEAQSEG